MLASFLFLASAEAFHAPALRAMVPHMSRSALHASVMQDGVSQVTSFLRHLYSSHNTQRTRYEVSA